VNAIDAERSVPAPTVAAISMGYGHLRAAAALAERWGVVLAAADRAPLSCAAERLLWGLARNGYHLLSRLSQHPRWRRVMEPALDRLTAIDPGRHGADGGRPPVSVRVLAGLVDLGFGAGLGRRARSPLVTTFYASAFAAERHGPGPVACVVTDSHVHRVWAPHRPATCDIHYLVPVSGTADCLAGYGVRRELIRVTGFPLPPGLVGSAAEELLERNLAERTGRLTAAGSRPLRITVAVGGAGAQADRVVDLVRELRDELAARRVRLDLVAGTHRRIGRRFRRLVEDGRRSGLPDDSLRVLSTRDFLEAYRGFNRLLAETDVLWTKPSELVFYAALGLPLVLEPPVGDHERHNRRLVVGAGAAVDRPPAGETAAWLARRRADGWFLAAASAGRGALPAGGTEAIATYCSEELYGRFTGA
jgi:hypothetical protein